MYTFNTRVKNIRLHKIVLRYFLTAMLLSTGISAFGQNSFKAILLSQQDSTPVAFAIVKMIETGNFAQTNSKGEFHFQIPQNLKKLHFEISAIGFHDTIIYNRTHSAIEKIYINRSPVSLSQVNIKGLTAKETVKKAVDMIPINYSDSSFASFSFFRQYDKVNGVFKNLIEAQTVILFKIAFAKNRITSSYGFDIEQMRRSNFNFDIDDSKYYQNNIAELLDQNPVYNLLQGSLNPNAFNFYTFNFDTTNKTDDYVIKYSCSEFSSENHGVDNMRDLGWSGEGMEEGVFIIDRKSFAFKKIERTAIRNKDFNYPKNNNWVLPSRHYYAEFVDGKLVAEFEKNKSKWFLKKLCHTYTNEYFKGATTTKEFTITENYEWYSDSVTHFIASDRTDKFYLDTYLPSCDYTYNKSEWDKRLPPFQYYKKEDIYDDLNTQSPIEEQFEKSGKQHNVSTSPVR